MKLLGAKTVSDLNPRLVSCLLFSSFFSSHTHHRSIREDVVVAGLGRGGSARDRIIILISTFSPFNRSTPAHLNATSLTVALDSARCLFLSRPRSRHLSSCDDRLVPTAACSFLLRVRNGVAPVTVTKMFKVMTTCQQSVQRIPPRDANTTMTVTNTAGL